MSASPPSPSPASAETVADQPPLPVGVVPPPPAPRRPFAPSGGFVAERAHSRDLGLALGLLIGRVAFETEHLHFGYWDQGLDVKILNMPAAQERYTEVLLASLPADAASVLDVGCGAGAVAERLVQRGLEVECVCPSPLLAGEAGQLLGDRAKVHELRYQEFETDRRFDLVLFSESFQYCPLPDALQRAARQVREGGHVLICDFFQRDVPGDRMIRGGHSLAKFQAALAATPFEVVEDEDVTRFTAPTQDLANDVGVRLVAPLVHIGLLTLEHKRPWVARFVRWKLRKKLAKMERKYFSGVRDSEHFAKFLTYRRILLRRTPGPAAG